MSEACACNCCGVAKCWQGIVELVLRITALVSSLILICCGIAGVLLFFFLVPLDDVAVVLFRNIESALGWLAVVGLATAVLETILLARFCCSSSLCNTTILLIVDTIVTFVIAVVMLFGAIAIAAYIPSARRIDIRTEPPNNQREATIEAQIDSTLTASAVFSFWTVLVLVALGVFMILSLVFKWKNASKNSSGGKAGVV